MDTSRCVSGVPLLRLPHVVEQLDQLLVDDEDDGHVQAHSAQPGNGSLVEAVKKKRECGEMSVGEISAVHEVQGQLTPEVLRA